MTQAVFDPIVFDDKLSNRFIELDPSGYFIIFVDRASHLICAEFYTNTINKKGLACDPETGEPLPCGGELKRQPSQIFQGRTAKELCIEIFEQSNCCVTRFDHAAYLGREFVRAEQCLFSDRVYVQD
ncbi:MAG TPA: DUF4346 domain-containing protein [Leptolyngbya sp.]|jgi:dihydropteroate synthase|nr:DUF4346 domain-containing protein [Leptolyngbya sp.]